MSGNCVFSGNLSFTSLSDIFQILGGNGSSGVLKMNSRYAPHPGEICFFNGEPINAAYGFLKGKKAIYYLFGWTEGIFYFYEKDTSGAYRQIIESRMEIVLDALRMIDDGSIKKTGPMSFNSNAFLNNKRLTSKKSPALIRGPLFDYLHVVREEHFEDGEVIIREGKHGKWIWTVFQGAVKVTRNTDEGAIEIARLGEGCFIGTFRALMFGEYERNATVTAEGDVRLCLLDSEPFYREYASLSRNFKNILLSLDSRLRRLTDKVVELQAVGIKDKEKGLNNNIYITNMPSNEELYSIIDGTAYIVGKGNSEDIPLLFLNKDDVFGNIPFLDFGHEPRSASVLASKNIEVNKLDIQSLQDEYNGLTHSFRNLIFNVGTYISMTTDLVYRLYNSTKSVSASCENTETEAYVSSGTGISEGITSQAAGY